MNNLGFGLMRLPQTDPKVWASVDLEQVKKLADSFLEKGFTYFDTAYVYHNGASEAAVKQALVERHPRDSFQVATKMPIFMLKSAEDYQKTFDEQLKRTGLEYFDYYLLHNMTEINYARPMVGKDGFDFVKKLKAAGKAKNIGFSYHDGAAALDRILTDHPEIDVVQLQINYLDWDNAAIQSRECYEVVTKHGKPVIVMEPVKGGALAKVPEEAEKLLKGHHPDLSVASWAIRFAASLDNAMVILSGMNTFEQIADNAGTMKNFTPLSGDERAIIQKVTDIIKQSIAIPCTACRYCVEECPQQIPIPQYFSLFNDQKQVGMIPSHRDYYAGLALTGGKASDCLACQQCEEHCPQHLTIVEYMKEVSAVFDK
ncbi:MAG: aldo/keto reductase [Peptococcaceae bacterium]|jgi:predicted aldo/keto reductase-like oxidoreductase|nr:aldo/keto reductase [Peptococcaceae bacterium]